MTDDRDDEMLRSPDEQEERENADMANTDCVWLEEFLKAETVAKPRKPFWPTLTYQRESGGETMLIQQRVERLCREQMLATR